MKRTNSVFMALQSELLLTRIFPIFAFLQAYFFFKTIWDKKNQQDRTHLYMGLVILLIIGTNTYALYQIRASTSQLISNFQNPIQMEVNFYMTILTLLGFLTLIFISRSSQFKKVEKGIALIIFIFTLINVGFTIQSFGNSFIQ
jgi:hypothetical protein